MLVLGIRQMSLEYDCAASAETLIFRESVQIRLQLLLIERPDAQMQQRLN